jgi:hypothetical protein
MIPDEIAKFIIEVISVGGGAAVIAYREFVINQGN